MNFVEVFENLLKGLHECEMAVQAAVVRMSDYGNIENCWRLVVVAISNALGSFADDYKIPIGEFSDEVAYTAEHVATSTSGFRCGSSVGCKIMKSSRCSRFHRNKEGSSGSSRIRVLFIPSRRNHLDQCKQDVG